MVMITPPTEDLESKIFNDVPLVRIPLRDQTTRLALYKETSPYPDERDTILPTYSIAVERQPTGDYTRFKQRHVLEKVGTDETKAREVYSRYVKALESGDAYLVHDEEKGSQIFMAIGK